VLRPAVEAALKARSVPSGHRGAARGEPKLSGVRIREEIEQQGYEGSKTILDDLLRELPPRFLPPPRSFQRTRYRPGEPAQFDLCEPRSPIPVGYGQSRRGYVVTCELPYSRASAGALVFSKEFPDIAWGMRRCRSHSASLPGKLVGALVRSFALRLPERSEQAHAALMELLVLPMVRFRRPRALVRIEESAQRLLREIEALDDAPRGRIQSAACH
jgi:hypothetical protein